MRVWLEFISLDMTPSTVSCPRILYPANCLKKPVFVPEDKVTNRSAVLFNFALLPSPSLGNLDSETMEPQKRDKMQSLPPPFGPSLLRVRPRPSSAVTLRIYEYEKEALCPRQTEHSLNTQRQIKTYVYRAEKKSWYVVTRNFFLLLLNFSAWPCLGAA